MSEVRLVYYIANDGSVIRHEGQMQTCVARFVPDMAEGIANLLNAEVAQAAETFRFAVKEAVDRL